MSHKDYIVMISGDGYRLKLKSHKLVIVALNFGP